MALLRVRTSAGWVDLNQDADVGWTRKILVAPSVWHGPEGGLLVGTAPDKPGVRRYIPLDKVEVFDFPEEESE